MKRRKENVIMKKYCTKCGHEFEAVGREVICPDCKAQAAEETKRAAVLRAKRASWTGESVPVRISGRASTIIREYGVLHNLPFAAALDALLKGSEFFQDTGKAWEDVTPYKSHRRDKSDKNTSPIRTYLLSLKKEQEVKQDAPQASKPQGKAQDASQDVQAAQEVKQEEVKTAASKPQDAPQDVQGEPVKPVKMAAKKAVKTTSKASASKTSTSKK